MKTSYNPENKDTFYYVDDYGMLLRKPSWEGQDLGERDSISRNSEAYFAWRDKKLVLAIRACFLPRKDKKGFYLKPYRHPNYKADDMSRDHILGALLAECFFVENYWLKTLEHNLRYKISENTRFTPDLWAWMKMLVGKWWWSPVFFVISYLTMTGYVLWNKFWYWYGKFSPEVHHLNWYPEWAFKRATISQLRIRKELYPIYALNQFSWQLYVLKRNIFVRGLQWLCLKITPRYNFVVRLLLGDNSVKELDVDSYKIMTGDRWGVALNETCDRHVKVIKDEKLREANRLDEDLLKKLWQNKFDRDYFNAVKLWLRRSRK